MKIRHVSRYRSAASARVSVVKTQTTFSRIYHIVRRLVGVFVVGYCSRISFSSQLFFFFFGPVHRARVHPSLPGVFYR